MLTFQNLSFGYKRKTLLFDNFCAQFPAGKTLLLGPNGSGKSTLFAIAAGVLKVDMGSVSPGFDATTLMPQEVSYLRGLTVREQVAYAGWLAGKSPAESWAESLDLLERVNLSDKSNQTAKSLSGGQLRRMGIAQALIPGRPVLLLDEPTAGLDLQEANSFYKTLDVAASGKTIIVSSHQIEGLGGFFDHVALICAGQIQFLGSFDKFVEIGQRLGAPTMGEALVSAYNSFMGDES